MTDLLSRLPHVRGAYHPATRLAQHTWFGVGGRRTSCIVHLMRTICRLSGGLSGRYSGNSDGRRVQHLVRDAVAGVAVKMNAHLTSIHDEGTQIIAKTGATDADVARYAQKAGISF